MKCEKIFNLLLLIISMFATHTFSQTKEQRLAAAGDVIDGLIKSTLGPQYHCVFGIDVDSTLGDIRFYSYPMEDPYSSLQHCIIFTGGRDTKEGNFIGVFKDGAILWRSDTTILGDQPNLFTTQDLNRSGQVDLVFESAIDWSSQLWIFSWNGFVGKRINAIDSRGQSVLQSIRHSFALFDANGDGILEIRDGNIEDGSQTWSWNGSEYGSWPDTPHLPSTTLWPRNKIDVIVHCNVTKSTSQLIFNYSIYNKPSSLQKVYDVRIWGRCDSISGNFAPSRWEVDYNNGRGGSFFSYWNSDPMSPIRQLIMPGVTSDGFKTTAFGLPAIEKYDAQGFNAFPNYRLMTDQQVVEIEQRDEIENSIHGFTIAPINPLSPFIPLNFIDTLSSYIRHSHTLGWINDTRDDDCDNDEHAEDGIVKNLDKRLDKVKDLLVSYKFPQAKNELQKFLNKVEKLWNRQQIEEAKNKKNPKIIFTSEAYALLKYNAEYLVQRLTVKKQKGDKD
jgi:hypothetical protein